MRTLRRAQECVIGLLLGSTAGSRMLVGCTQRITRKPGGDCLHEGAAPASPHLPKQGLPRWCLLPLPWLPTQVRLAVLLLLFHWSQAATPLPGEAGRPKDPPVGGAHQHATCPARTAGSFAFLARAFRHSENVLVASLRVGLASFWDLPRYYCRAVSIAGSQGPHTTQRRCSSAAVRTDGRLVLLEGMTQVFARSSTDAHGVLGVASTDSHVATGMQRIGLTLGSVVRRRPLNHCRVRSSNKVGYPTRHRVWSTNSRLCIRGR
mmetsp:Transcript_49975/g.143028  ORF Transcript_49975/g.143028 Transcript_49975/m.143028 type:complete len:263 (+) Transcript_49975:356-1144(+)